MHSGWEEGVALRRHILALLVALAAAAFLILPSPRPAEAAGVAAISAGGSGGTGHICALATDGTAKCWGNNIFGQLGDGTTENRSTPVDVLSEPGGPPLTGIKGIAAGGHHTCAVMDTGSVKCWGDDFFGQLGLGAEDDLPNCSVFGPCSTTPADVVGLEEEVATVAAGTRYSCALMVAGGIKCWGLNFMGQLGDGTGGQGIVRDTPVDVVGLSGEAVAVSLGSAHTCALMDSGGVECWGSDSQGQLGAETTMVCPDLLGILVPCSPTPVVVEGLAAEIISVTTGGAHTCAVSASGSLKCWGPNFMGQLGDGQACETPCQTPVDVTGLGSGVVEVSASFVGNTCAITTAGAALCWGANLHGQLGTEKTVEECGPIRNPCSTAPVEVCSDYDADEQQCNAPLANLNDIAIAYLFGCASTNEGGVKCWGSNRYGQLGDGTQTDRGAPVDVIGLGSKTPAKPQLGDVNCDGALTSIDATLILQLEAGLANTLPCIEAADVDADGAVTSLDAVLILQFTAGLITSL